MNTKTNSHLGKKILYSIVIALSGLMLLLGVIGIIGAWVVERPLSDAAVTLFSVVENSTQVIRVANHKVDQTLAVLEEKTSGVADATQQISQNISDKGLVLVLLPEEKEQQLVETAISVQETYAGIRESIAKGLALYQSINRIPFVHLPGPSENQMDKIGGAMVQIQALVGTLRSGMSGIRSGVTGAVDQVSSAANLLTEQILRAREASSQVDSSLAAVEALAVRLQQIIPAILIALAVIVSLIFAFLIFTQVEVILLYVKRWRDLGQPQVVLAAEPPAQTDPEDTASPEGE